MSKEKVSLIFGFTGSLCYCSYRNPVPSEHFIIHRKYYDDPYFFLKRTPSHLTLFLLLIIVVPLMFSNIASDIGIPGTWELSYTIAFILATIIIVHPFIISIENRIIESESKYKKAFQMSELYHINSRSFLISNNI